MPTHRDHPWERDATRAREDRAVGTSRRRQRNQGVEVTWGADTARRLGASRSFTPSLLNAVRVLSVVSVGVGLATHHGWFVVF